MNAELLLPRAILMVYQSDCGGWVVVWGIVGEEKKKVVWWHINKFLWTRYAISILAELAWLGKGQSANRFDAPTETLNHD